MDACRCVCVRIYAARTRAHFNANTLTKNTHNTSTHALLLRYVCVTVLCRTRSARTTQVVQYFAKQTQTYAQTHKHTHKHRQAIKLL